MLVATLTQCRGACPLADVHSDVCGHPTAVERRGPPDLDCSQLPADGSIPTTCPLRDGEFTIRLDEEVG